MSAELHGLHECISKLNPGKAVSFDGIHNQQKTVYNCTHLCVHLYRLYDALLWHCVVHSDFCVGVIIPLLKNKHGDHSNLDMYRGTSVAPAISKLSESILLQLYGSYLGSDPPQFGFKKESSCNSALFTSTEAIKYCNNLGSKDYCAFLDASKKLTYAMGIPTHFPAKTLWICISQIVLVTLHKS